MKNTELMKKFYEIKGLADGTSLVDVFDCYYHKEADGIVDCQTNRLITWAQIEHNNILLSLLTLIKPTED